jgi:hypothetical protein
MHGQNHDGAKENEKRVNAGCSGCVHRVVGLKILDFSPAASISLVLR